MPIRLRFEVDDTATPSLARSAERLPVARRELVERLMREGLTRIVERNPVETGRSRTAWVQSLERLGGQAPPGWTGPLPSGVQRGRTEGRLVRSDTEDRTLIEAMNAVPYIAFLEYGTVRMSAFAMVRKTLAELLQRLNRIARR